MSVLDVSGMGCPLVRPSLIEWEDRRREGHRGQTRKACRPATAMLRKTWPAALEKLACAGRAAGPPCSGTSSLAVKATRPAFGKPDHPRRAGLFLPQSLRDRCQFQAVATIASSPGIVGRQPSSVIA